jgi:dethiobiotin synthetase
MKTIVVAGIGTGVGKTIISSILVEALQADYWKPIQAGDLDNSDTLQVKRLCSSEKSFFHEEKFRLNHPMSPHAAAALDGIKMEINDFEIPKTSNSLVIELAGGLMVPIHSGCLNIDLVKKWKAPVVLVSQNYLGSINHTLLSLEILKSNKIPVLGVIFNGEENKSTEAFILNYSKINCLGRVQTFSKLDKVSIAEAAKKLAPSFF